MSPPPFSANPASPPGLLRVGSEGQRARTAWDSAASPSQALAGRGAVQPLVLKLEARLPRGDFQQPILTPEVGTGRARALSPSPGTRRDEDVSAPEELFSPPSRLGSLRGAIPHLSPVPAPGQWQRVGRALCIGMIRQLLPGTSPVVPFGTGHHGRPQAKLGLQALGSCGGSWLARQGGEARNPEPRRFSACNRSAASGT